MKIPRLYYKRARLGIGTHIDKVEYLITAGFFPQDTDNGQYNPKLLLHNCPSTQPMAILSLQVQSHFLS